MPDLIDPETMPAAAWVLTVDDKDMTLYQAACERYGLEPPNISINLPTLNKHATRELEEMVERRVREAAVAIAAELERAVEEDGPGNDVFEDGYARGLSVGAKLVGVWSKRLRITDDGEEVDGD